MEAPTQSNDDPSKLVAQLREAFGRVVYSHKTHEKCADSYESSARSVKYGQIVLAALTTGSAVTAILADSQASLILTALLSTFQIALNLYTKNVDPGALAERHKEAALKLWNVRESYLSLLVDIRSSFIDLEEARTERDELQNRLAEIYASAPRTTTPGYKAAQKALKVAEDLTFSPDEIDAFLPEELRSTRSVQ